MPFFKISFLVPHIPLLEIYFCVLWRLLTFLLVCKILNTCQVIDFGGGGSVLKVKVCRNGKSAGKSGGRRGEKCSYVF